MVRIALFGNLDLAANDGIEIAMLTSCYNANGGRFFVT
jgi:hypothetical protein